jgi:hypothetical protein
MKFMAILKSNASAESGAMPSEKLIAEMGQFNEELVKAGVLLAAEGLHPSSRGARIRFGSDGGVGSGGDKRTVIDGPFTETKEMVAGFWIIEVSSKQEAVEWMKRCPHPFGEGEAEIELRQIFAAEDFGAEFTPELREQEERLRQQVAAR